MRRAAGGLLTGLLLFIAGPAAAQSTDWWSVDSAVGVSQFVGEGAADRPDVVIDVTASVRLGSGWVAYVRPWFRKASTVPYALSKEIYQAAVQHERSGRISTRVDLGYILSPIGLGMLDMRPDTNATIMPHMSYLIPMPPFDAAAPPSYSIASSYPLGAQVTASSTKWDVRGAVVSAPPNRMFVLGAPNNPPSRPVVVVGGGMTPRTGLRLGVGYAAGKYSTADELRPVAVAGRQLHMLAVEGDLAFGYTRITAEIVQNWLGTARDNTGSTEWFLQGQQTLTPRWFVAARHEGANAPSRPTDGARPTLRMSELTAGFRLSPELTMRSSFATRKTYFTRVPSRQAGVSLVWARRLR